MTEHDRIHYEMITVAYPVGATYHEVVAIQRLVNAGYRKADEVRKEIFSKLIEVSKNFDGNLPLGVLKAWAIEYGVEVE